MYSFAKRGISQKTGIFMSNGDVIHSWYEAHSSKVNGGSLEEDSACGFSSAAKIQCTNGSRHTVKGRSTSHSCHKKRPSSSGCQRAPTACAADSLSRLRTTD